MLEQLKAVIVARFPELTNASFTLLTTGWDSLAVDVDNRLIFKFPREDEYIDALRTEVAMLKVIRPRVTLSVPDLDFFETPQPFSRHTKLSGSHVETAHYALLGSKAKQKLADDIALFYAELHAIEPALLEAAGAQTSEPWPASDSILAGIQPYLPESLVVKAEKTLDQWAQLPADPYGTTFGFFDGHGWNMAFDHETQTLNGIYDFGDSGFSELHEEFVYTSFISPDLTRRVITQYEQLTGRRIDSERVSILTGVLLLVELADMGDHSELGATVLTNALTWLSER